jgi:uncharacterized membrane protein
MSPFTLPDYLALAFFVTSWFGYHIVVERSRAARRSLNRLMDKHRADWMYEMRHRDLRIIDTSIMATLQSGTAFFASTSLLALGGSLALLRATDDVVGIAAGLPLGLETSRLAWELKIIGLVMIFGYAFFKFSWAYRVFNYAAILIGATPMSPRKDEPESIAASERVAAMSNAASRHFNRGQRAFFFALAYLGWFVGPYALFVSTAAVLVAMWRRQFSSDARAALGEPS